MSLPYEIYPCPYCSRPISNVHHYCITALVTGSRDWTDEIEISKELSALSWRQMRVQVYHGDCRGADKIADRLAKVMGYHVVSFPADWGRYGKGAGPKRNQEMVALKPDVVLAFHQNVCSASKGTKDCVSRARIRGIPVLLCDGHGGRFWLQDGYETFPTVDLVQHLLRPDGYSL